MRGLRSAKKRQRAGDDDGKRVEYDEIEGVFRIYRGRDLYCATVVRYDGEVSSFELVDDSELVIRGAGGLVSRVAAGVSG